MIGSAFALCCVKSPAAITAARYRALQAQKRAQAVLTECGYTWPGCVQVPEPIAAPFAGQKSLSTQARVDLEQFPAGNQLKCGGKAQSPPGRRRIDPYSSEHRVGPSVNSRST
jgi:hypothetical protein